MLTLVQVNVNSRPDKIEDSKDVEGIDDNLSKTAKDVDDHVAKPNPPVQSLDDHVAKHDPPVQYLEDATKLFTNVSPHIARLHESMRRKIGT